MASETEFNAKRNYSVPTFNSQLDTIHFTQNETYEMMGDTKIMNQNVNNLNMPAFSLWYQMNNKQYF